MQMTLWLVLPGVSLGILHLVAATGLFSGYQYFLYLSGLLWGLVIALINFYMLLSDTSSESRAA
jgi:hypothetical protein